AVGSDRRRRQSPRPHRSFAGRGAADGCAVRGRGSHAARGAGAGCLAPARPCGAAHPPPPGWRWPVASPEPARWVVDGRVVDDHEVTGVFVRRTHVYPEELVSTHPDDRAYLAAESTAFLIFVLSRTAARVVNPVAAGARA